MGLVAYAQYLILHRAQCEICMEGIVWMADKGIVSSMNQQLRFFCLEKTMVLQLCATYATCVKCQAPRTSQGMIHIYCKKTLFTYTQYLLMQHESNVVHTISQNRVFTYCIHLEPSCAHEYIHVLYGQIQREMCLQDRLWLKCARILISWEV